MGGVGELPDQIVTGTATPAVASGPVLQLNAVSVRFEQMLAVREVSFQLRPGDLLGLIGPNGAGKTTLLRTACGLQRPSGGEVRFLGEPLEFNRADQLSQIGFTPDVPPVYDGLTVRQFLKFIGKGYGLPGDVVNDRIGFWLEKVWLAEKADAKIKNLSRGMKQRVGLARTLLPNPALILLDEPAAGLDPVGRVQFRQLLCDLRDQGKAIIVSSHILSDMADYCTHVGIMTAGRLVKFGTVAEVTHMHGDDRCRYTLRLASPLPQLDKLLAGIDGVSAITGDRTTFSIEFTNTPAAAAGLLATLVAQRVPVCGFSADAADLEQAYLRVNVKQVD